MKADELYSVINGIECQLNILKNNADKLLSDAYLCGKADQQKETADHLADIDKQVDEAYQRGLDDAWEAARKIVYMWTRMGNDEILAIFGITERIGHSTIHSLFGKQTVNEAMLKLEAYEEKQKADDEIKVGDEVYLKDEGINGGKGLILRIDNETCTVMWAKNGSAGLWYADKFVKTGRHFDIDKILEEMKK